MTERTKPFRPKRKEFTPDYKKPEDRTRILVPPPASPVRNKVVTRLRNNARCILPIRDGCIFIISDQHYYPGERPSKAHRASLTLARKLKPYAIINNGDSIDGASISRWPVSSFLELGGRPTVASELVEVSRRLKEFEALPFVEYCTWNLGNHDGRFETKLAEKVPEFAGVDGFSLHERYPGWIPAWRTDFCSEPGAPPELIIKHRFKGGMHAAQNNVLWSGTNIATGHDHMLKVYQITTSQGLRWGINCGTMAPIDSPHFLHYTEDDVKNWQQGFPIIHFRNGRMTGIELLNVTPDGRVLFRGDVLDIK